jgi:hypothetical protein
MRFLAAFLLALCFAGIAVAQKPPINAVAGPTTGAQFNTIMSGPVLGATGGTGVANLNKTITLGGNLATTGAFDTVFSAVGSFTYTLPAANSILASATGTLVPGNIANQTSTGIIDSGVVPITSAAANTAWSNNAGSPATPAFNNTLALVGGTAATPAYAFSNDVHSGLGNAGGVNTFDLIANSFPVLRGTGVASSANYMTLTNSAAGAVSANFVTFMPQGSDTNISFGFSTKGDALYRFVNNGAAILDYGVNHGGTWTFLKPVLINSPLTVGVNLLSNMNTGEIGFNKIAATGSAPGANGAKMELVCGTNAGSGKLIVYGGTSTTPVTIVDNIGAGITGC